MTFFEVFCPVCNSTMHTELRDMKIINHVVRKNTFNHLFRLLNSHIQLALMVTILRIEGAIWRSKQIKYANFSFEKVIKCVFTHNICNNLHVP